jgi:hypothetical protein
VNFSLFWADWHKDGEEVRYIHIKLCPRRNFNKKPFDGVKIAPRREHAPRPFTAEELTFTLCRNGIDGQEIPAIVSQYSQLIGLLCPMVAIENLHEIYNYDE